MIVYALLAGLFFALARAVARLVLKKEGDPLAFTSVHDFIAGLILLPLLFLSPVKFPEHQITWLFFLGIIIFAFISDWLSFLALKKIGVSLYQIVNQVRHIFVLFGGLLLLAEPITAAKLLSIPLIIAGVGIVVYEKSKMQWSSGVILTLFSSLAAVIAFFFVKFTVVDFSETATASLELMLVGLLGFSCLGFSGQKIANEIKINKWGLIISGGLFGFFELFLFLALKAGEVSKAIPITQSSLIFGVLIGVIFLQERDKIPQKIIGTILIILGILTLNYL